MKTVTLSVGTVEIADTLTWGMQEAIKSEMLGGIRVTGITEADKQNLQLDPSALTAAKYKVLELCVKKITLTDGTEQAYSKEWMNGLSIQDGDTLFNAVDEIANPKKK